jgi:hypothetical protein
VAPWSTFWDRNLFVGALPGLTEMLVSPYARGAISGIGAVTAIAGVAEFAAAFHARRAQPREEPKVGH